MSRHARVSNDSIEEAETGGVSGNVWQDFNADGVRDGDEPSLAGFRVYVYADLDHNGAFDAGEPFCLTDAYGNYLISSLEPGPYSFRVELPAGWEHWYQTHPLAPGASGPSAHAAAQAAAPHASANLQAPDLSAEHIEGQLIVKLKGGLSATETARADNLMASIGAEQAGATKTLGIQLWDVHGPLDQAIHALMASGLVEFAEPNYIVQTAGATKSAGPAPNDLSFGDQWGLDNIGTFAGGVADADIDAPEAWQITTGSSSVIVGVIDTGIDYTHVDLDDNIWTNPGEIAANGIDDDGNGYVDDVHGYDFANGDADPMDDNGHGTHASGILGAEGNNGIGVSGVAWDVSLAAIKAFDATGHSTVFNCVLAIEYATMMGFKVTSNSWGFEPPTDDAALRAAIADAGDHGDVFVCAAGNAGRNIDLSPTYPPSLDLPNIITVTATAPNDTRPLFANYGATSVDLGAPGAAILSTLPGNAYGYLSGTSMAAPFVTGAVALMLSLDPNLTPEEVRATLLSTVDPLVGLAGRTVSGGRLNLFNALSHLQQGIDVTVTGGSTVAGQDFGIGGGATPFADALRGTANADTIGGLDGDDTINAEAGDDQIYGGRGADRLGGAGGDDLADGGNGRDTLLGSTGADAFVGGSGIDTISFEHALAGVRAALLAGGTEGDAAGDTYASIENMLGSDFDDELAGANDANVIKGGSGNDRLAGRGGDDVIKGGNGGDTLRGGGGGDVLNGGFGDDDLTGGGGADVFLYRSAKSASDTIQDFAASDGDTIWIDAAGIDGFGDLAVGDDGLGNAVVSWTAGGLPVQVTLIGVAPGSVDADMFTFGHFSAHRPTPDAGAALANDFHAHTLGAFGPTAAPHGMDASLHCVFA